MRIIDADELERRIREAEKIFYNSEDVGIAIDCIDATKTISEWHYPSRGEYPPILEYVLCFMTDDTYEVGYYQGEIAGEPEWAFTCFLGDVIAWMPLPEPPKEEA